MYDIDSIRTGIENPRLIKKELADIFTQIKYRNSSPYKYNSFSAPSTRGRDAIYQAFFNDIDVNQNNYRNFKTYLDMVEFANYADCDSILEIGAGVSTTLWAQYAARTGASVTSIDADTTRLEEYIQNTAHEKQVSRHVDLIEGVSVEPKDIIDFYSSPKPELGSVPIPQFKHTLDKFTRSEGAKPHQIRIIGNAAKKADWKTSDVLIRNGCLHFPDNYLSERSGDPSIEAHASILDKSGKTGVINDLITNHNSWDFIWFDSGEVSSMVEWELLKDYVSPGGLVAFHDIFFPKSMKNFAIAASLVHDPDWNILLIDDRTKQGLLIATKSVSTQ